MAAPTVVPAEGGRAVLETADVQGLLASGYATRLRGGAYVLLEIVDRAAARAWLTSLAGLVTNADAARTRGLTRAVQVAFTRPGLEALGLSGDAVKTFSREFQEGMATPHRGRILGDEGDMACERWEWGGPATPPVHVLLLLFAARDAIEALYQEQKAAWSGACREVLRLDSFSLDGEKEHFGFHDGIAQPEVEGLSEGVAGGTPPGGGEPTRAGEFVLGYRNEYGMFPDSPSVVFGAAGAGALADGVQPGTKDLGRNGSYLVFRQLEQDVAGFWRFLKERAAGDTREAVWLGAKMVGRWPNGAPLALFPDAEPEGTGDPTNNFMYLDPQDPLDATKGDPYGQKCPVGSHVRRTNPRDSLEPARDESLIVTRRHRILRRGRAYGPPLAAGVEPPALIAAADDQVKRGLLFLCLNADIARQFEFIQQTWVVNPKFEGLCSDPDPLIGPHCDPARARSRDEISAFTIPRDPVRRRETALRRFVTMRGGAYFFVPGLRALRFLAGLP